jgi:putative transposase
MAHTYCRLLYHVIFSTKHRQPLIDAELRDRLYPYLGGIVRNLAGDALNVGGIADHVHLLISLPQTVTVAEAVRLMNCNSSKWVHETWPERSAFAWQTGYGAFSVSQSCVAQVMAYINNQETHHRRQKFQEEFVALLQKHEVIFDESELWD